MKKILFYIIIALCVFIMFYGFGFLCFAYDNLKNDFIFDNFNNFMILLSIYILYFYIFLIIFDKFKEFDNK